MQRGGECSLPEVCGKCETEEMDLRGTNSTFGISVSLLVWELTEGEPHKTILPVGSRKGDGILSGSRRRGKCDKIV